MEFTKDMVNKAGRISRKKIVWGAALAAAWALIIFFLIRNNGDLSIDDILNYCPESYGLALLALFGIFLLKSVDFLMPTGIIFAAVGIMFPFPAALLINMGGACIMLAVPYAAARQLSGIPAESLLAKNEKLRRLHGILEGNYFLKAFLLRSLYVPLNVGTLYMSLMEYPFGIYLAGSLLGWLPSLVCYTLIGMKIDDWRSPEFWICIGLNIVFAAASLVAYRLIQKGSVRRAKVE